MSDKQQLWAVPVEVAIATECFNWNQLVVAELSNKPQEAVVYSDFRTAKGRCCFFVHLLNSPDFVSWLFQLFSH